ncbi:MAG: rhomboid family intramembrane serine protease [Candidatus Brocadiia bacterium]|jgi:membrane associated rhomboid family serine protease
MPYGQEQHYEITIQSPAMYFTRAGVTFILLMIAGYAVSVHWSDFALGQLALNPTGVLHGRIWQLVTYLFVDPSGWSLVWNCSCVLIIGSALEREWRTRSVVALWFLAGISCALIWMAVSLVAGREFIGCSADSAVYGFLGAFGLAFRRKRFLFFFWGMEAQYVVLILVAIGLILGIAHPITWIWVAGAGVGYLYLKVIWKLREGFTSGGKPARQARFKDLG